MYTCVSKVIKHALINENWTNLQNIQLQIFNVNLFFSETNDYVTSLCIKEL